MISAFAGFHKFRSDPNGGGQNEANHGAQPRSPHGQTQTVQADALAGNATVLKRRFGVVVVVVVTAAGLQEMRRRRRRRQQHWH